MARLLLAVQSKQMVLLHFYPTFPTANPVAGCKYIFTNDWIRINRGRKPKTFITDSRWWVIRQSSFVSSWAVDTKTFFQVSSVCIPAATFKVRWMKMAIQAQLYLSLAIFTLATTPFASTSSSDVSAKKYQTEVEISHFVLKKKKIQFSHLAFHLQANIFSINSSQLIQ